MSDPVRDVRPLLREGAVPGDGPDAAVPAHYGAPLREQRHLLDGTAVVDLGQLELLEARGADARSWLTTVSTQILTGTPVGTSRSLAVLSPKGKVEHMASAVVIDEDAVLLVADPGARAGLLARRRRRRSGRGRRPGARTGPRPPTTRTR